MSLLCMVPQLGPCVGRLITDGTVVATSGSSSRSRTICVLKFAGYVLVHLVFGSQAV